MTRAVLLFLMAAVALPDETGDEIDLRAYYTRIQRRYWLLFGAQWATLNVVSIWAQHAVYKARVDLASPLWLIVPITVALAFISSRAVQALALLGFIVFYTAILFGQTLS